MPRPRIPDDQLTPKQLVRRRQNDRARGNVKPNTLEAELFLCPQLKKAADPRRSNSQTQSKSSRIIKKTLPIPTQKKMSPPPINTEVPALIKRFHWDHLVALPLLTLLMVCCVLSYHLQIEVYESLKIVPEIQISGYSVIQITAALIEILLVVMAALAFKGRSRIERLFSGALFIIIGGGTATLLWHGQEVALQNSIVAASIEQKSATKNSYTARNLEDQRRSLELQRNALLKQVDADTPGSFAAGGASGLVRDSLSKLDRIQDKIENIDMRVESSGSIDKIGRTSEKLTRRTTFAAEVLRIVLLLVTAFLVHVILARIKV